MKGLEAVPGRMSRAAVKVIAPPTELVGEPYPGSPDPRLEKHLSVWRAPGE